MPIPLPNLDDLTFDELVAEGKRMIPGLAPGWTDHNPSDPGITFIELFAFVAELLMYRANTVSEADKRAFVKLLRGRPDWPPKGNPDKTQNEEIRDAVRRLRNEERAVTPGDFGRHALEFKDEASQFLKGSVARAHCLTRFPWVDDSSQANVTVLVVPGADVAKDKVQTLIEKVRGDLEPRCPLTTRLKVSIPPFVEISVHLDVYVFPGQIDSTIKEKILDQLSTFFNELEGGTEKTGWPFGRAVYVSDVYALMDGVDGVDYVTALQAKEPIETTDDPGSRRIEADIEGKPSVFVGISLKPNELVAFLRPESTINIKRPDRPLPEE